VALSAADKLVLAEAGKKALDLLARREHSTHEMGEKLRRRGFEDDVIDVVIADLHDRNYLSDSRFAETFVEQRLRKGHGERSIRSGLTQRGISTDEIRAALAATTTDWSGLAIDVLARKLPAGFSLPSNREEAYRLKARYARFLQGRGFSSGQIRTALETLPTEREQSDRTEPLGTDTL